MKTVEQPGVLIQALRIIRRRKLVILQAVVIVPILALLFSLHQKKEYTATATLLFRPPPTALGETGGVIDPIREAATNSELVSLPVVAEEAEKLLGGEISAGEIFGSIEVSPSGESETATISSTTTSAERSATIANAYGEAYISFRRSSDRGQVEEAIKLAETSFSELSQLQREGGEGAALSEQVDQLKLVQALQTGGAELVQPAEAPTSASTPKTKRNVVLGLAVGILLGIGLALLLEQLDRRVRTVDELEELYGLPILARIPRSRKLDHKTESGPGPRTPEGEAFRVLRTNLRYFAAERDMRSILLISHGEGDGKSTISRGLAMTMAEMGDKVVLVEADLRKGGEYRTVTGQLADGLSNVLAGTPLDRVLLKVKLTGEDAKARPLALLPSGQTPPNPAELLEGPRMAELLERLQEEFELVIVDSPALGAVGDGLSLIPRVDGVVILGGLHKTTRDGAAELIKQFELLDRRPIGVVANFTDSDRAKYSHYYRAEPADQRSTSR